jgi:hypothetical protein
LLILVLIYEQLMKLTDEEYILKQVINILSGYGIESDIKQKQEDTLPLGESVIPEAQPSLVVG